MVATGLLVWAACGGDSGPYELEQQVTMSIQLTTPTMPERDIMPKRHTCEAEDLSPPLEWSGLPAGTASIAILAVDADADEGEFTHWTVWNIPADASGVDEAALPTGAVQGENDFESVRYRGPCPPPRFSPQGEAPVRVDPPHRTSSRSTRWTAPST